jgi:hypothetical protein
MKFVAFGDSFVNGFSRGLDNDTSLRRSFVNKLQNHLDYFSEYQNKSTPGASNTQIAYDVYKWLETRGSDNYFIFIAWTTFIRESYWEIENYKRKDAPYDRTPFSFFKKWNLNYIDNNVKKQLFDIERNIFSIAKILENLGLHYNMIQSFDDHTMMNQCFLKEKEFPSWINWNMSNNTLIDICCERYLSPTPHHEYGMNHKEFQTKNKYLTDCMHPNEEGHSLIAETLSKEIEKYLNEKL